MKTILTASALAAVLASAHAETPAQRAMKPYAVCVYRYDGAHDTGVNDPVMLALGASVACQVAWDHFVTSVAGTVAPQDRLGAMRYLNTQPGPVKIALTFIMTAREYAQKY